MEEPPEVRQGAVPWGRRCGPWRWERWRLGVPLTGYMFLMSAAAFSGDSAGHRPSFIPFLRGQSQSGKSAFAAFMLNYFGYDLEL